MQSIKLSLIVFTVLLLNSFLQAQTIHPNDRNDDCFVKHTHKSKFPIFEKNKVAKFTETQAPSYSKTTTPIDKKTHSFDAKKGMKNTSKSKNVNRQSGITKKGRQVWKNILEKTATSKTIQTKGLDFSKIKPLTFPDQQAKKNRAELEKIAPNVKIVLSPKNNAPIFIGASQLSTKQMPLIQEEQKLEAAFHFMNDYKYLLQLEKPSEEFELRYMDVDKKGNTHIRMDQVYKGLKIWGKDVVVHLNETGVYAYNGRYVPTPNLDNTTPFIPDYGAMTLVETDLRSFTKIQSNKDTSSVYSTLLPQPQTELMIHILEDTDEARLVWNIEYTPNIYEHWHYLIDAKNGEILKKYNDVCHAGPTTATATDANNVNRNIHVYEEQGTYYMLDASRPMYSASASSIPNEPIGAILTLDLKNQPYEDSPINVVSSNNTWSSHKNAVSAHYNASVCYEYFKNTFGRNSIDGSGGTIISIVNVAAPNGGGFDNAFWNGIAMFYGNGDVAFNKSIVRSLDTGGHEMAHGVTQHSADLIYEFQSGALNESFSDVFGVLIDRDDWKLGEDIVNPNVFPSGAMRDMSDPHNGCQSGSHCSQPAHMNEYQNLSADVDHGGVHINSGIPNKAFYLFATAVGKETAEQVYYHALTNYLTKSSQFIDCRLAVVQSAQELYNSNIAGAAASAFDQVGIFDGNGGGGGYEDDLPSVEGVTHMLLSVPPGFEGEGRLLDVDFNTSTFKWVSNNSVLPKASVLDNGSVAAYIGTDNNIYLVDLTVEDPTTAISPLTTNGGWRKIALSKDGNLIAALSTSLDNKVYIFSPDDSKEFTFYNPSTANDGSIAGYPDYADAIEFDHSGEYLMYDAYNSLNAESGFWDIGILHVWNKANGNFGSGNILKIFPPQASNISVGNASFAKNSPYIITFDYLDSTTEQVAVVAANLETGNTKLITQTGGTLGLPSYDPDDAFIAYSDYVFDSNVSAYRYTISIIQLAADKITPIGESQILIYDAQWPIFYKQGERAYQAPVANFEASITEGPAPLTVNFFDVSENSPSEWNWSFNGGNPTTSNTQNPIVTFNSPGTYGISLSVSNPGGNDTETKTSYIKVIDNSPCEIPTNIQASSIGANSATITWNQVNNATAYFLRIRRLGTSDWGGGEVTTPGASLSDALENCTEYEYQVQTICNGSTSNFSNIQTFTTTGCQTGGYCASNGNSTADEWIEQITIGSTNHTSGNNDGYSDFTGVTIPLEIGENHPLTLTPGFSNSSYTEYWRIWIDYNRDNDFEDNGEMVFDAGVESTEVVNDVLFINESATEGSTRMRISMKWVGEFENGETDLVPPSSCGTFNFGEVEDYTINLIRSNVVVPVAAFSASTTTGTTPLSVTFSDNSTNEPTSWSWSFPGASPSSSTLQNPSVVYNNAGTFPVTLNAANSAGNNSKTIAGYISVESGVVAPVAAFGSSIVEGVSPLTVTFFDESSNEPSSWNWSFPGGIPNTSQEKFPTVTYENVGCYNVSLTAINDGGSNTHTKPEYICVIDVGIEEEASSLVLLKLSPNPTNGTFQLSGEFDKVLKLQIRISDIFGREIDRRELETSHIQETIHLPNIASGMYFLSVETGNALHSLSFVIK